MPQLLSGRLPSVRIGIPSYSEDLATLSVVGISSLDKISAGGSIGGGGGGSPLLLLLLRGGLSGLWNMNRAWLLAFR